MPRLDIFNYAAACEDGAEVSAHGRLGAEDPGSAEIGSRNLDAVVHGGVVARVR